MRVVAAVLLACTIIPAYGSEPCTGPEYQVLSFWVGEWNVYVGETRIGTNRIAEITGGCAITERWEDARGSHGFSLFYFAAEFDEWRQVWVTNGGTIKEKRLIEKLEGGGVRFLGKLTNPDGIRYFDRTTILPLADRTVRQVIEVSEDGTSWQLRFDARYERVDPTGAH